jgi:colanic acid/amylovoran biosynthesis glycosyltransferase
MRGAVGYVLRMFPQASETFVANEVAELERRGCEVRLYSYRRPAAVVPHALLGRIRAPVEHLPDPLYRHPRGLLASARAIRRLEPERFERTLRSVTRHCVRERKADSYRRLLQASDLALRVRATDVRHLHAHFAHGATRVAMLTSQLTGIPFSFTAHARDVFSDDVDFSLLREKAEAAKFVVTVSRFNAAFLAERLGTAASKLRVVYNGVDLGLFSPDDAAAREEDLVVGVGRLVEKKGFSSLVEACRILRDQGRPVRCQIVGEGELRGRLQRQIQAARLEGSVHLAGLRAQEELPDLLRRATVLAMPAVPAADGNRDALPTVLLEALACGTPVVASRLTGIPEIVDHNDSGLLVEPGDARGLAAAIDLVREDPQLRTRLGHSARAKAERCFDLRRNVGGLHELLLESLGETREDRIPVL